MYMKKESIFNNDLIRLILSKEVVEVVEQYTKELMETIKCNFDYGGKYFNCNIYTQLEELLLPITDDSKTILKVVATIEYELKKEFGKSNIYCNKRLKIIPVNGLLITLNSELVVRKNISPYLIQCNEDDLVSFLKHNMNL